MAEDKQTQSVPESEIKIPGFADPTLSDKTFAVKIYTTAHKYDYKEPWLSPVTQNWTGSGFIIDTPEGKKIVTNAHVAGGAVAIEVHTANDSNHYFAEVETIGHTCDLAILTVKNPKFWEKTEAVPLGESLGHRREVEVHGFPKGGDNYCVTDGIVSRSEQNYYAHSYEPLLTTQVTAPINPGNSGGAVLSDGKVVGVVHQGMSDGQNIGYMIPVSILKHFLHQAYEEKLGFPGLDIATQDLLNSKMRSRLKMREDDTGVLVTKVPEISCAHPRIKPKDILLEINGYKVGNDGKVELPPIGRVDFNTLINNYHYDEKIEVKLLRKGRRIKETISLYTKMGETSKILPLEFEKPPTYYMIPGGIVVQPVGLNFMLANKKPYKDKPRQEPGEQMLAISNILQSEGTVGFAESDFKGDLITAINGHCVHNMQELIRACETNKKPYFKISLKSGKELRVDRLSEKKDEEISKNNDLLERYHIRADRSKDLMSSSVPENKESKQDSVSAIFEQLLNQEAPLVYSDLSRQNQSKEKQQPKEVSADRQHNPVRTREKLPRSCKAT